MCWHLRFSGDVDHERQVREAAPGRHIRAVRMLSPSGNPQARNLFEVINHLQRAEGLHFELRRVPGAPQGVTVTRT